MFKHIRLYALAALALCGLFLVCVLPAAMAQPFQGDLGRPRLAGSLLLSEPITITLQQGIAGYGGGMDTYISEYARDANYVTDQLHLRAPNRKSPLLRFDLSGQLPAGAQVQQATLSLYTSFAGANPIEVQTFRVLRGWDATQVTWNQAADGAPWNLPGADGLGTDREENASDLKTLADLHVWYDFDVTAMAQAWLNDPTSNRGVIVKSFGPSETEYNLASNEYPDSLAHPQLLIVYTLPATATPTPLPTRIPTDTATPTPTSLPATPTPTHTPPANRIVVTFQFRETGYMGVEDTYLDQYFADRNHADEEKLLVRAPDIRASLLRFDISAIPTDATVYSATLSLFATNSGGQPLDIGVYRVLRPWNNSQATWNQAAEGAPWGQPGCDATLTDRAADPEDAMSVLDAFRWYSFSVTNMAQVWANDNGLNHGLILKSWTDIQVEHQFASSNLLASEALRPRLIVSYYLNRPLSLVSLPLILRNHP